MKRLTMKDKDCKIKNHICRINCWTVILYVNKDWLIHRSSLTKLLSKVKKKQSLYRKKVRSCEEEGS